MDHPLSRLEEARRQAPERELVRGRGVTRLVVATNVLYLHVRYRSLPCRLIGQRTEPKSFSWRMGPHIDGEEGEGRTEGLRSEIAVPIGRGTTFHPGAMGTFDVVSLRS